MAHDGGQQRRLADAVAAQYRERAAGRQCQRNAFEHHRVAVAGAYLGELEPLAGGTLAVLGRNGVGKTTLLATIMGHTTLRDGSLRFAGRDISRLPAYRRVRLGMGFVPQEREIFRSLTVEENLVVAARPGRWSIERVYDFFPALAERRRNGGNQ